MAGIGDVKKLRQASAGVVVWLSCGLVVAAPAGDAFANAAGDVSAAGAGPSSTKVGAVRKVIDPFAPGGIPVPKAVVPIGAEGDAGVGEATEPVVVVEHRQEPVENPRTKLIESASPMGCVNGKVMMQGATGIFMVTPAEASANPASSLLPCGP